VPPNIGGMTSSTLSGTFHGSESCQDGFLSSEQVTGFPEEAGVSQGSAARGALTGVLLGVGMWAGLFYLIAAALKH
jgi:hypothetical protein